MTHKGFSAIAINNIIIMSRGSPDLSICAVFIHFRNIRAWNSSINNKTTITKYQFTCACIRYGINLCFRSNSTFREAKFRLDYCIDLNSDSTGKPIAGDYLAMKSTNEDTLTVGLSLQIDHIIWCRRFE